MAERYIAEPADQRSTPNWRSSGAKLFAPTGGVPVDNSTIGELRNALESLAGKHGFPQNVKKADHTSFDDEALRLLVDAPIPFGEAIRPETWAWIAVVLVPDLVRWRWEGDEGRVAIERFAGPLYRNCFGRLWYQGSALDRGREHPDRWGHLAAFGADQVVALLERPSLGANRAVCLEVAEAWNALPEAQRTENLFRETMKALIVRAAIQRLDFLDRLSLRAVVREAFSLTMSRLRLS